ncbi:MAG: DUF4197 domain-containing protein [Bacteroidia bacterium]|nr:DUF4197 domain-containing protein [Bacteroidia bacterium]MDW8159081.1 DUF4197 domain-containing protein [Bacteroidia bacterium]
MNKRILILIKGIILLLAVSLLVSGCLNEKEDTQPDIVAGLKEALSIGTNNTVRQLNVLNGYYANPNPRYAAIKILLPQEAQAVESTLRSLPGMNSLVDTLILQMNRAAEDAASEAGPIFLDAIRNMTFEDAMAILKGDSIAATTYMRRVTYNSLEALYTPKIKNSMEKVGAQQSWHQIATAYNRIPFVTKLPTDISAYVTQKALDGLFFVLSKEEINIRRNPAARVTKLLRDVFKLQD